MLNVLKPGSVATLRYGSENKEAELSELAKSFFKDIDFSVFDKDFIEQEWKHDYIKKIATKVTIKNGALSFDAPYGHKHGRFPDVKYVLIQANRKYKLPDCEFIVFLNDAYASSFPSFSIIRRIESDTNNVPFPMGNIRGQREGCGTPVMGWDEYIQDTIVKTKKEYPWEGKENKAVFRGQFAYQTWKLGEYGKTKAEVWTDVNRGHLYNICKAKSDLFDVGFNKIGEFSNLGNPNEPHEQKVNPHIPTIKGIPFVEQQQYKYIICVGTNANWAERLRTHLFTGSVLVKHEAECIEWFYPLMKPWEHYIPFDLMMLDLEKNIEWANEHEAECQKIVENANGFAEKYLNEDAMILFASILIKEYAKEVAR
jgi:hypothetical protein